MEPCHQWGWSNKELILSILALGALPKQQQSSQRIWLQLRIQPKRYLSEWEKLTLNVLDSLPCDRPSAWFTRSMNWWGDPVGSHIGLQNQMQEQHIFGAVCKPQGYYINPFALIQCIFVFLWYMMFSLSTGAPRGRLHSFSKNTTVKQLPQLPCRMTGLHQSYIFSFLLDKFHKILISKTKGELCNARYKMILLIWHWRQFIEATGRSVPY